jgi:hypothetical protein
MELEVGSQISQLAIDGAGHMCRRRGGLRAESDESAVLVLHVNMLMPAHAAQSEPSADCRSRTLASAAVRTAESKALKSQKATPSQTRT